MPFGAFGLKDHLAVMREVEPFEAIEYGLNGFLGRAGAISVLNAKQKLAFGMARIEPIEQCGPRAANMKKAGRRGGESSNDGHAFLITIQRLVSDASRVRHVAYSVREREDSPNPFIGLDGATEH